MPATYRCASCNSTWNANREPTECPNCGSRTVEPWGHSGSQIDEYYEPPQAPLASTGLVSSVAFSILYWLGWVGIFGGGILIGMAANDPNSPLLPAGGLVIFVAAICLLAAYVVSLVKLYRAWDVIQPLRRLDREEVDMATPGKAVGFLFIPFYNLYWMFVAWPGLATRANKYMIRKKIDAKPMRPGLSMAYCILTIGSIIPFVGSVLGLINAVIYYIIILDLDRMRTAVLAGKGGVGKVDFIDDLDEL